MEKTILTNKELKDVIFNALIEVEQWKQRLKDEQRSKAQQMKHISEIDELPIRAKNVLINNGFKFVHELKDLDKTKIKQFKNAGVKTEKDILKFCSNLDLK